MSIYKSDEPFKLRRTDAPETSVVASEKVNTARLKKLVHTEVINAGFFGITGKEICAKHPELPYSSITARPAALEREVKIFYKGDKRNGARIIRDIKWKTAEIPA